LFRAIVMEGVQVVPGCLVKPDLPGKIALIHDSFSPQAAAYHEDLA